jgi:hypothetical protein
VNISKCILKGILKFGLYFRGDKVNGDGFLTRESSDPAHGLYIIGILWVKLSLGIHNHNIRCKLEIQTSIGGPRTEEQNFDLSFADPFQTSLHGDRHPHEILKNDPNILEKLPEGVGGTLVWGKHHKLSIGLLLNNLKENIHGGGE